MLKLRLGRRLFSAVTSTPSSSMQFVLPVPPKSIASSSNHIDHVHFVNEITDLQNIINCSDSIRDEIFTKCKDVSRSTVKLLFTNRGGDISLGDDMSKETISKMIEKTVNDPSFREGKLSQTIEKYTECVLFANFFRTGTLASQSEVQPCSDEEYLGACLGFAQEIARYCVGRASEELLLQLNGKFLEFDFRNGPLRRKYDGLKYALKNIEDISFELSLINPMVVEDCHESTAEDCEPCHKRIKLDMESKVFYPSLIALEEFDSIRMRLDAADKKREEVIKISRDVQKLAKQGIFALQRGDLIDSEKKIMQAKNIAFQQIFPITREYPFLRTSGSFSSAMEEWVEAYMFLRWRQAKQILPYSAFLDTSNAASPTPSSDASNYWILVGEYLGGLADFTGELGRLAVAAASLRQVETVQEILQVQSLCLRFLLECNSSGRFNKKVDMVQTNVRKVEDIVYELSLLLRGGKALKRDPADPAKNNNNNSNNNTADDNNADMEQ